MKTAEELRDIIKATIAAADAFGGKIISITTDEGRDLVKLLTQLINTTKPRLLTADELFKQEDHTVLWAEDRLFIKDEPFMVEYDKAYREYSTNGLEWVANSNKENVIEYGAKWRLWTAMPTKEQRRSTKWEGEEP